MTDLRVAGDEHDVQVGGQQTVRAAQTVVGGVEGFVPLPAAPHRDGLRGDAGVLLGDEQLIGEVHRAPDRRTEKIEDSDSHRVALSDGWPGPARTTISNRLIATSPGTGANAAIRGHYTHAGPKRAR